MDDTNSKSGSMARPGIQVVWVSDADPETPASAEADTAPPITAAVSGVLDDTTADAFAEEVIDLVFAIPPRDVVLDLRDVVEIGQAGVAAIRCAHLALDDQGARLVLLCPQCLEPALHDADVDLELI
ncbi:MAG: STAS domain-containing protein [Acidimicrobiales bacterium]